MATPTLKKETIQIVLEKGNGTILVSRSSNTNPNNTIGVIHTFTYTGNAAMALVEALAAARRKLDEQITATAAKPAAKSAAPATTAEPAGDDYEPTDAEPAGDDDEPTDAEPAGDDDEPTDDEPAPDTNDDPAGAPHFDELSAPPELEPITIDDPAGDDPADDDFQALLF